MDTGHGVRESLRTIDTGGSDSLDRSRNQTAHYACAVSRLVRALIEILMEAPRIAVQHSISAMEWEIGSRSHLRARQVSSIEHPAGNDRSQAVRILRAVVEL